MSKIYRWKPAYCGYLPPEDTVIQFIQRRKAADGSYQFIEYWGYFKAEKFVGTLSQTGTFPVSLDKRDVLAWRHLNKYTNDDKELTLLRLKQFFQTYQRIYEKK